MSEIKRCGGERGEQDRKNNMDKRSRVRGEVSGERIGENERKEGHGLKMLDPKRVVSLFSGGRLGELKKTLTDYAAVSSKVTHTTNLHLAVHQINTEFADRNRRQKR